MPERNFRYVGPDRVEAWKAVGWRVIGWTRSPHDGKFAAIVEWPTAAGLMEPSQNGDGQISLDL